MKSLQHIVTDDMDIHIIYAGFTYATAGFTYVTEQKGPNDLYLSHLCFLIYETYNIKSFLFTMISMFKGQLVTKEMMKSIYQGLFNDETSVGDDLELFFEEIKLGNDIEMVSRTGLGMYYLPKLTVEEMILLNNKDEDYLRTFIVHPYENPDVNEAEMELSESKSKFACYFCVRTSIRLTLASTV